MRNATAKNNTVTRNQQRIAAVQQLRASKNAARITARNKQAYMLAVQQLATQYGLPAPTQALRSVSTVQKHAASTVKGACGIVRAYVTANPTATVLQVKQHFSATINPATVATQYNIARKQA